MTALPEQQINSYPLNKESARILLELTSHPGWSILMSCFAHEAQVYSNAALQVDYGPNALEKFRYNQALAMNIPRIPRAIIEAANDVLDDNKTLDSVYDDLWLDN